VFLMPGSNIVCLLAGHLKIQTRTYFTALVSGIVVRLVIMWYGGKAFEEEIRSFLGWIDKYQWWVVGALFALTAFQGSRRKSPGAPEA
jgi:uncharacterized membrane protein YdjX (TVP38/TMEM64 family)